MTNELYPPSWVNDGYFQYLAAKGAEERDRVASDLEDTQRLIPAPSSTSDSSQESTQVLASALEKSKALDTERMRRRDWAELTRARNSISRRESRRSIRASRESPSGVIYVIGIFALALLIMSVVWWGATWLEFLLAVHL